jgi:hypothetical protein
MGSFLVVTTRSSGELPRFAPLSVAVLLALDAINCACTGDVAGEPV